MMKNSINAKEKLNEYTERTRQYFIEHGNLRDRGETEQKEYMAGIVKIMDAAIRDLRSYVIYEGLIEDWKKRDCRTEYCIGCDSTSMGRYNPTVYERYVVKNYKPGRIVKKLSPKMYPSWQYFLEGGELVRTYGYGANDIYERGIIYEDIFSSTVYGCALNISYGNKFIILENKMKKELFSVRYLLYWEKDANGNTVRVFLAPRPTNPWTSSLKLPQSKSQKLWMVDYEENTFIGTMAKEGWYATLYGENYFLHHYDDYQNIV